MKSRGRRVRALVAGVSLLPAIVGAQEARFWPQWRGPLGTGVAPHADPPLEWSEERNVRFKVALPGRGHSTSAPAAAVGRELYLRGERHLYALAGE